MNDSKPIIAVLGTGHCGHALAGQLAIAGYPVNFVSLRQTINNEKRIKGVNGITVRENNSIRYGALNKVTTSIADGIKNAKIILCAVPALLHKSLSKRLIPLLQHGQFIYFASYFGANKFNKMLAAKAPSLEITVIESMCAIHSARTLSFGEVEIFSTKDKVPVAANPGAAVYEFVNSLADAFPCLMPVENTMVTSLNNVGPILHVPMLLMNVGNLQSQSSSSWTLYHDGISPAVKNLSQTLDNERIAIANSMGIRALSMTEIMMSIYYQRFCRGVANFWDWLKHSPIYARQSIGRLENNERCYLTEGIACGLSPLSAIAKVLNIATPAINATIEMGKSIMAHSAIPGTVTLNDLDTTMLSRHSNANSALLHRH